MTAGRRIGRPRPHMREFIWDARSAPSCALLTASSVTLTARLYFEHLLDHDQYVDWLLSSLEAAPINVLPFWLMLLGLYWDSLVQYRKRGRRLAEVLLEKSRQVGSPFLLAFLDAKGRALIHSPGNHPKPC